MWSLLLLLLTFVVVAASTYIDKVMVNFSHGNINYFATFGDFSFFSQQDIW